MFATLPASSSSGTKRSWPSLLAVAVHVLAIGAVVGRPSASPAAMPAVHRDTIRFHMAEVEPALQPSAQPSGGSPPEPPRLPDLPLDVTRFAPPPLSLTPGPRPWMRAAPGGDVAVPGVVTDTLPRIFNSMEVDQLPELITELHPRYPEDLERARVSGRVELEYVVERDGRVDPRSVRVLTSTHPKFLTEALKELRRARFRPARRGGHAIDVLVRQAIRFHPQ